VINTFPHDRSAFTEGLVYLDGVFFESTGLRGQSTLRIVDPASGQVRKLIRLADRYFGEGIAVLGERIYQLTWQEHTGFIYDRQTLELLGTWTYATEGWGLTHDDTRLIMSDGTANLYFLDPDTQKETGRIQVHDGRGPVTQLNELEYVAGEVLANVWHTNRIARIDPSTGLVLGWIDLTDLLPPADRPGVDVLNGIAYDAQQERLFVTGKWWPNLTQAAASGIPYPVSLSACDHELADD
jgi:glutamine cyclotransferase